MLSRRHGNHIHSLITQNSKDFEKNVAREEKNYFGQILRIFLTRKPMHDDIFMDFEPLTLMNSH